MKPHDTVVLRRPLPDHGLQEGDVGAITHCHSDEAFEVEFITGEGTTIAVVTLTHYDLRPVGDRDMLHVRSLAPR